MVQVRARLLIGAVIVWLAAPWAGARKFYSDDPIWRVPTPISVGEFQEKKIDALYDFSYQSFRSKNFPVQPSGGVNTLGEVPDSAWFTNRHGRVRLTRDQLQAGAGAASAPIPPFEIAGAKTDGITPGFRMRDSRGRLYFVKPDPLSNPELATAAEVVVSRFFHAIGYFTPENYLLTVDIENMKISPKAKVTGLNGRERPMDQREIHAILDKVPFDKDGKVRVVASLGVEGSPRGPFRYEGTRTDDPNDLVPHEQRRDLRGLYILCAWLNHTDAKAQNSLDTLVEQDGVTFVRHYLIDFGSTLGSDSDMVKNARFGNEFIIPRARQMLAGMFTLGLVPEAWESARHPKLGSVGRIESQAFDPLKWNSNYPNPAFLSRNPGDDYWAAKIVMAFTDDDIRAIVETGRYSDPRAVDYLTRTLAERRDKIGRACFTRVLALDNFSVSSGELKFDDLAQQRGFVQPRQFEVAWSRFDNELEMHAPIGGTSGFRIPREAAAGRAGEYFAAKIHVTGDTEKTVTVFLRKSSSGFAVAGVDRTYPGVARK